MSTLRLASSLSICLLLLGACERAPNKANDVAVPRDDRARAAAKFVERTKTDREALRREVAELDYRAQRALMTFGGLDEELGGAQLAEAALRGLMMEMKRLDDQPKPDLAQWMKAQAGSGSDGSFAVALSSFEIVMVSLGLSDLSSDGEPKRNSTKSEHGTSETVVTRDTVSHESAVEGTAMGLTGKILTQMKVNVCPDASGKVAVEVSSKSSLSRVGGAGGVNTTVKINLTRFVDDDAHFGDDIDLQNHVDQASFGANGGTFVDIDMGSSTLPGGKNGTRVNRRSSKATDADVQTATDLAKILELMAYVAAESTRKVWESGRCVKLEPTTDPAKRTGIKPSTSFSVLAAPRSAVDGSSTGGTVRGSLSGDASLDPSNAKVKADATFTYLAPSEKSKRATVALEARSKRGVAKAEAAFSTEGNSYSADGGADEFHGTGTICDLAAPFTIQGSGVVVKFVPSSALGGSYSYTGSVSGFALFGNGTYTVKYQDEVAVAIVATGPGSVKTPMGTQTNTGTEHYTLVPAGGEGCN